MCSSGSRVCLALIALGILAWCVGGCATAGLTPGLSANGQARVVLTLDPATGQVSAKLNSSQQQTVTNTSANGNTVEGKVTLALQSGVWSYWGTPNDYKHQRLTGTFRLTKDTVTLKAPGGTAKPGGLTNMKAWTTLQSGPGGTTYWQVTTGTSAAPVNVKKGGSTSTPLVQGAASDDFVLVWDRKGNGSNSGVDFTATIDVTFDVSS